jgi:tetratricopeptide (TPR) repeat protein
MEVLHLTGSDNSYDDGIWRVFISHTSELRDFPRGKSYVAEVERAISAAGHVIVDMADFPAADQPPAQMCIDRVRGCDVYLGILGTRYGSLVRDMPQVSYTELEFNAATEAGLDRLVFMLDTNAEAVAIPISKLIDREFGARQDALRQRVRDSGLVTQSFTEPATLGQLVERSLRELAQTRRRIDSGISREQAPAEPQPTRRSSFVNPPPGVAPTWFQGRQAESRLLAQYVRDPGITMVTVAGRGGIGKTACVCRLLKGLEVGRIPDAEGDSASIDVGGIVYLSSNSVHKVEYPTLVTDLLQLLPTDTAQRLQNMYQDPHQSPRDMMLALLEAFPVGKPVVVLLDNLESVMDPVQETLTEEALDRALSTILAAPAHAVTIIVTTRVMPTAMLKVEPAKQRQIWLKEGLGSPDAQIVLRELDGDGRLGLRDADDELLDGLRRHTRGFPRALEAVKAILEGDHTLTPRDLLGRIRHLPEDQVIQVLVGEAYDLLDEPAKQVMQALSIFPEPVSAVGIDFLLQPVNPTTDAALILSRLVRRQVARFQDRHYDVHPIDRDYARSKLSRGGPDDSPAAFTLTGLQVRAADYYKQIRKPRNSWKALEDIRPQLTEFDLRCVVGDYDTAATVLRDIDYNYLNLWGHYRTLIDMHRRIHGKIKDPTLDSNHLLSLGQCLHRLGAYEEAINLFAQVVTISRRIGNRGSEAAALGSMGLPYYRLGDYGRAVDLHNQSIDICRRIGNRGGEAAGLCNLALCYYRLGDYETAVHLHNQNLDICRRLGNRRGEGLALGNLGLLHLDLGNYGEAIDLFTQALAIARDVGDSNGQANALDYLGRAWLSSGDARRALTLLDQAVKVAEATGDVEPRIMAGSWLARAQLQLGDLMGALAAVTPGRTLSYPTEEPIIRLLEGLALLALDDRNGSMRAFSTSLTVADALLALADRNVAAMQVRALALSGIAAASGDPTHVKVAAQEFDRIHSIANGAGMIADTRRLFTIILSRDRFGLLAEIRAVHGL